MMLDVSRKEESLQPLATPCHKEKLLVASFAPSIVMQWL